MLAEGDAAGRRADLCRGAGDRFHQYRRACGPGEMLRRRRARSSRPSRRSRWCRNPSATMPPSRRCRPRSIWPSRRSRSGRSPSWNRKSPQTRSIIRRDSIWRPRSTPQGKRAEATEQLLEIVKRDRKWNEDGARKQLVQFFEAWGGADEATVEGRKRLSTILFS